MRAHLELLLCVALFALPMFGQDTVLRVYTDHRQQTHVALTNGKNTVVGGERGQVGIDSIQIAKDGRTAGWLVLYANPDGGSALAGTLVVWRSGKIIQRFKADQTFWSWAFYANAAQVAYHVGPAHGQDTSHCELHDVEGGRQLASWDGDLDDANRPPWTRGLDH
jgi:hypothetical protein